MSSSNLGVSCDKLCLVIRVVVHKRTILSKVGWNMSCGYGAPGRKTELDIDCVLERTRGMLAEVTFDPTGQV